MNHIGSCFLQTEAYVIPENRKPARAMLRRVLHYNDASKSEERFTGAHFDIERHMLGAWKTDRLELSVLFLERLDEWMKIADDSGLEMSAAIPFWLDDNCGFALHDLDTWMKLREQARGDQAKGQCRGEERAVPVGPFRRGVA